MKCPWRQQQREQYDAHARAEEAEHAADLAETEAQAAIQRAQTVDRIVHRARARKKRVLDRLDRDTWTDELLEAWRGRT